VPLGLYPIVTFSVQLNHFISGFLSYSVSVFPKVTIGYYPKCRPLCHGWFASSAFGDLLRVKDGHRRHRCCFVLDFEGDLQASAVRRLSQQVTLLSEYATKSDEVVVRLKSPGISKRRPRQRFARSWVLASAEEAFSQGGWYLSTV
jgi:hypothetical protein